MRLTIITINLNKANGLEKTIQSVVEQTFNDFEYIVIDGGSADNSVEVINEYSDKIHYWTSEPDRGIYHAMNKGIAKANGNYCLFLNSGDYLLEKDILKNVFSVNHREDILYGNCIFDYGSSTLVRKMPTRITLKHMIRSTLWHPASFIRKDLLFSLGMYDEELMIASDYDFFLKAIFTYQCSLFHLDKTVSVFSYDGLSSLPINRAAIKRERYSVQLRYFNQKQIQDALRRNFFEKSFRMLNKLVFLKKTNFL